MAASQQPMAGGSRPTPAQVPPPQGMVPLQHPTHAQQPHLVPMMPNPAAAPTQFSPAPNFQIPLQHPQRSLMGGMPPGAHQQNFSIQNTPQTVQLTRPNQMRQFQNGMPVGIYPTQLPPGMHSHQLQQLQQQLHQQSQQSALRLNPQMQMIPQQQVLQQQQQGVPGPGIAHMPGPTGQPQVLQGRYS